MKASTITRAALVGCGATALMDIGGDVIQRRTGVPPLNLSFVGRWIGHMPRGRFAHTPIMVAVPVPHEDAIGLAAHYSIGAGFAVALVAARPGWLDRPSLLPALGAGLLTTAAPWFVMQPAFGLGVAASKTPQPHVARLRSLRAHAIYGVGLYIAAKLLPPARVA